MVAILDIIIFQCRLHIDCTNEITVSHWSNSERLALHDIFRDFSSLILIKLP